MTVRLRCPACHAALIADVVIGRAPAPPPPPATQLTFAMNGSDRRREPTRAEQIARNNEADPEACGRRWVLDVERDQLAQLEDELRASAGMTDERRGGR